MAGIAAYFGNDQTALSDLADGLASRGVDIVTWREERLGLAVRAALPVIHTSGHLAAVVEGVTETSRLLTDYDEHGPAALVQPGDPYAIAAADPRREALLLARSGDGPALYYTVIGTTALAAAEPQALVAAGTPAAPDPDVIRAFVDTAACDTATATCFAGIRRVLPGQVVTITRDGVDVTTVSAGRAHPALPLPLAIQDATRHGRIGVRLGGAVDDGAVLAAVLGCPNVQRPLPAYQPVLGGADEGGDDDPGGVVTTASVRHEPVPASSAQFVADLPAFLADVGEPVPDLEGYLLWTCARASMGSIDTLLVPGSGQPVGSLGRLADRVAARFGVGLRFPVLPLDTAAGTDPEAVLADMLRQIKDRVLGTFLTPEFASRPWVNANAALSRFDAFLHGRGNHDAGWFWRLYLVEEWLRLVVATPRATRSLPARASVDRFTPNPGRQLDVVAGGRTWLRFPVRTDAFVEGDSVDKKVAGAVADLVAQARSHPRYRAVFTKPWYVVSAEKPIAVAQGRSYRLWEIQPERWARVLARLASRTPFGSGSRTAWTIELGIREVGRVRMLAATLAGLLSPRWYDAVAGRRVAAISGPGTRSRYPASLSATLGAADVAQVAQDINEALRLALPPDVTAHLRGCAVMSLRDSGARVRGLHADRPAEFFEGAFADNPLGQGDEQTPVAVMVYASAVRKAKRVTSRGKSRRTPVKAR